MGLADRPPRVFNSPYTTTSLDYNPIYRMSEFKVCSSAETLLISVQLFILLLLLCNFTSNLNIQNSLIAETFIDDSLKIHQIFQTGLSPATSEMNLFSRSTSPLGLPTPTAGIPRTRFSAYDSLLRRRSEFSNPVRHSYIHS